MLADAKGESGNAANTKARIVHAAQIAFAESGYSQTGLREIAKRAGVSNSLIIKYFKTKARLFHDALVGALIEPQIFQQERSRFGERIVSTVGDHERPMIAPAMVALSLGDEEARAIIAEVTSQSIIKPMAAWLDAPRGDARAIAILMLTTGYAIYGRHVQIGDDAEQRGDAARILANVLQAIVEGDGCN